MLKTNLIMMNRNCITLALALASSILRHSSAVRTFAPKPNIDLIEKFERDEEWVEMNDRTDFLPASRMGKARFLSETTSESSLFNPYASQNFVDGSYEYDEYQQAWRYLGFVIDCDASTDDDDRSGSYDGGTGDGCHRYVLWAAYVDLEYQGGGIGEYQYWDRYNQRWDDTSCQYGEAGSGDNGGGSGDNDDDGDRCAKMDCHLEDTHFSLLGFFKHKSYDDWMEQLFKHEGYCVWTSQEYSFMKSARKTWPQGCVQSGTTDEEGNAIYYDIKPTTGGGMTLGLYTDTRCVEEYKQNGRDDPINIENVVGNILMEGSQDSNDNGDDSVQYDTLEKSLAAWDSAFDIFKTCQPCVAYDLNNVGYGTDDDASKGSSYWVYNQNDDQNDGNQNGGDGTDFDCYDDADYTNVNQCMKFMAKTTMNAATYRDLSLAKEQGTLVDIPLSGLSTSTRSSNNNGRNAFLTVLFFMVSMAAAVFAAIKLYDVRKRTHRRYDPTIEEPLATKEGTMA